MSSTLSFAEIELALAKADYAAAIALADRLINFLERAQIRSFLSEARFLKACSLIRQGERETARDELTAAQRIAEAIGSRRMLWQILFALSELEKERGDFATAQTLQNHAREMVESIAAHAPDEQRKSFLNMPEVRPVLDAPG